MEVNTMNVGQMLDIIKDLPEDTNMVINNINNDWGEISLVGVNRFIDDDFKKATVVIEFQL